MVNIAIMIAIFILGCLITIVALALVRGTKEVEQVVEKPTIVEEPKPIKKKRVYKPRKPKQTEK